MTGPAAGLSPEGITIDRAFGAFWAARDPDAALARVDAVVGSGVGFEEAFARLRRGRPYAAAVPSGRQDLTHRVSGRAHPYTIVVPDRYDPTRRYPVRVQLHGGVGRPLEGQGRAGDQADRLPSTRDEIFVLPNAWPQSMWWHASQTDNVSAILDRLKRTYNVDENRVYMTGISDGATGAYFFAFRDPTRFASFLPLNGHMMVLANRSVGADGDLFPGNATNRPLFAVNGGRDELYPAPRVRPFVEHLERLGAEVVFHVQEEAGHNTRWWPEERAAFERFVASHPRDPHPDRLSWQTERVDRYNRVDWLVVDRLGTADAETRFADDNAIGRGPFARAMFPRSVPRGRIDLVQRGNAVDASTAGVRAFTLLLSPDRFDFDRPVTVTVNGRVAVQDRIAPDLRTLLEWAARDNDRTTLYGAELHVEVDR